MWFSKVALRPIVKTFVKFAPFVDNVFYFIKCTIPMFYLFLSCVVLRTLLTKHNQDIGFTLPLARNSTSQYFSTKVFHLSYNAIKSSSPAADRTKCSPLIASAEISTAAILYPASMLLYSIIQCDSLVHLSTLLHFSIISNLYSLCLL